MCKVVDYKKMRLIEGEPISNLKVGDYLVWNDGSSSEVVNIEYTKSGKTAKVTTTYYSNQAELVNGKWIAGWLQNTRTLRMTTLMNIRRLEKEESQEVSPLEQLQQEVEEVILSINTESLESQKESFEAVCNMLDKIYKIIEEYNFENEQKKIELKGTANHLKYYYNSLDEMIEKQTCPNANDFDNTETLKTVYITNWNELPEELQNYILSCDKYWIDLQWINLYKNNKIVASIGISGHHKHGIEINSIGAGKLFQWNIRDGYILNNLEVSVDKQESFIVIHAKSIVYQFLNLLSSKKKASKENYTENRNYYICAMMNKFTDKYENEYVSKKLMSQDDYKKIYSIVSDIFMLGNIEKLKSLYNNDFEKSRNAVKYLGLVCWK